MNRRTFTLLALATALGLRPLYFRAFPRRIDCEPRTDPLAPYPERCSVTDNPHVVEPVRPELERVWRGPSRAADTHTRWVAPEGYWARQDQRDERPAANVLPLVRKERR